jgi:hypothetical protein
MVFCLQNLRTISSKEEREAELALLAGGNLQEAEGHYIQGNKPLHAIMLHLNEHNWDRFVIIFLLGIDHFMFLFYLELLI